MNVGRYRRKPYVLAWGIAKITWISIAGVSSVVLKIIWATIGGAKN
jgi:hypothetical protein